MSTGYRLPSDARLLSENDCQQIFTRVLNASSDQGSIGLSVSTWWNGELKWARNRIWDANDRKNITLSITRRIDGSFGSVNINQIDYSSISNAVRFAEAIANMDPISADRDELIPDPPILESADMLVWDQQTSQYTSELRTDIANRLIERAENEQMMTAGYIETRAGAIASLSTDSGYAAWDNQYSEVQHLKSLNKLPVVYKRMTEAQCSVTVRHPLGKGSGWAGSSSFSWNKVKADEVADLALEKCLKSLNPVRIEPGRYVVILEPQAVSTLLNVLMRSFSRKNVEENGAGPWMLGFDELIGMWRSRLGLKVLDERITISHSIHDTELGYLARRGTEDITWIENGILKTLESDRTGYLIPRTNQNVSANTRPTYRMSGSNTSIEEMISNTARGLVVTRFSNSTIISNQNLLLTGITRDGLWLVEKGKITHAVQNMRFTESPIFAFNNVAAIGAATPVFSVPESEGRIQLSPSIVPTMKIDDFSFTSVNDAV